MDVPAEEIGGLLPRNPLANCGAAGVFPGRIFVQPCAGRGTMHHEVERFDSVECGEGFGDFFFGVFARSVEGRDVAVAQARPMRDSRRRFEGSQLPVKIHESQPLRKFSRGLVRFMISGKHPELLAERFENLTAALQAFAKSREVAGVDVDVRGLRHNARERF